MKKAARWENHEDKKTITSFGGMGKKELWVVICFYKKVKLHHYLIKNYVEKIIYWDPYYFGWDSYTK